VQVRLATPGDISAFAGQEPPEWCVEWVAYVAEHEGKPIALGTIFWDKWGRVWGAFDNKEGVSPFLMHRLAKRTITHLRSVGVEHLYAECSDSILGAEKWLRRLGFVRDGKSWRCDLSI
jgi:hypothetical protein